MKIEKINDNQIRCTLSKEDLADPTLNLANWLTEQAKPVNFFRI